MSVRKARDGFLFGCDPELFILDPEGRAVSAYGIIPGTKATPFPVEGGAVQVDGMAAEFNIEPADTFAVFNNRIERVMESLGKFLPKGHVLATVPAIVFDKEVFDNSPDDAKELGCQPDFDAWTGDVNPPPDDPENPYLRTASGHLHIGWGKDFDLGDNDHILDCRELCQQLDWHLGAWSTRMDKDHRRRRLYGKAGSFRPKPYGVEYRVLSNFWITNRDRRMAVWNRMQNAIMDMRNRFMPELYPEDSNLLRETIDTTTRSTLLEAKHRYPIRVDDNYPYDIQVEG